jgi:hypothetical protein
MKSNTKFFAAKHCVQQSHVGRLEGTETLAQPLTSLRQRTFDPKTQRPKHLSVQEVHQRFQFLLIEIKSNTPPAEIPQLDQLSVQAVGQELRKKLLSFLHPLPTTSNDANLQRFSEMIQNAMRRNKNYKRSPRLQTEPHIEAPNHTPADRLHNQDQNHMHSLME